MFFLIPKPSESFSPWSDKTGLFGKRRSHFAILKATHDATPHLSICLPNLNTRPYLVERIDCILAQTCSDWELVISDNYSDDGSWEFFRELEGKDSRVLAAQAPKEGMYANWNRGIKRTQGKYIYIATSYDTMAPDCLERMADALENNPACDLALCPLVAIDESSATIAEPRRPECSAFLRDTGELRDRTASIEPLFDGQLHLFG